MMEGPFLSSRELAAIAGIGERKAREGLMRCFGGGGWRGHRLVVRRVRGRGGKSGWQYQVRLDSLPQELQLLYSPPLPCEVPVVSLSDEGIEWRHAVIQEALRHPPGSPERRAAIGQIAGRFHLRPDGTRTRIAERTLAGWCAGYDAVGLQGLAPRHRADKGERRVLISHRWDRGVHLPEAKRMEIAGKLEREVRSLWSSLHAEAGWQVVANFASRALRRMTAAAAPHIPPHKLEELCVVTRPLIERFRQYRVVAIHDKDARRFFDRYRPRIGRGTANLLPMQVVMGDVHPIDIYYLRADGSPATCKAIFWMDVATERLWCTPVFPGKGRGIRQEDVIASFVAMVQAWGMPGSLYLDNGGEYNALQVIADALKLSMPVYWGEDGSFTPLSGNAITKAQPYNAPAKGLLEGAFHILEHKYFSMIQGWVAGDRTNKKTHNVGKPPAPFPGSEDQLAAMILAGVTYYNGQPRGGRLDGLSPNAKVQEFIGRGWAPTEFPETSLIEAFSEEKTFAVRQCRIKFNNEFYYHDRLTDPRIGDRVVGKVPLFGDRRKIALHDRDGKFLCIVLPDIRFDHDDRAGAKEVGRRQKSSNRNIAAMREETRPIDTGQLLIEAAAEVVPVVMPPPAGVVRFDPEREKAGRELAKVPRQLRDEQEAAREREADWQGAMLERLATNAKRAIGANR